jgi:hypothetical protein
MVQMTPTGQSGAPRSVSGSNVSTGAARPAARHFLRGTRRQVVLDDDALEVDVFSPAAAEDFGDHALRAVAVLRVLRQLDDDLWRRP